MPLHARAIPGRHQEHAIRRSRHSLHRRTLRALACAALAFPAALAAPGLHSVHAATVWYVSPGGTDSAACGTGAASACKTLGQAIANAGAGDTVSIAAGTYHELVVISKDLTLQGAGASRTFVDGTGLGGSVVTVGMLSGPSPTVPTVALRGLTVQHGSGTAMGVATIGGGILSVGTLTLTNCVVTNNVLGAGASGGTLAFGGGIFNAGTLILTGSIVSNNSITDTGSGAPSNIEAFGGGILAVGQATITNSTIDGNSVTGSATEVQALGGGIGLLEGTLTLTNSVVRANTITAHGTPGSTDSFGSAIGIGGGIFAEAAAATVTGSTVSGNAVTSVSSATAGTSNTRAEAVAFGGGIVGAGSALTVTGSMVSGNTATSTSTGNTGTATSNTLGLTSVSGAGGIDAAVPSLTASGDTISGNSATASTFGAAESSISAAAGGGVTNGAIGFGLASAATSVQKLLGRLSALAPALSGLVGQQQPDAPTVEVMSLTHSTITNNMAAGNNAATTSEESLGAGSGGGIANALPGANATLDAFNDIVSGNTASGSSPSGEADGAGGGIVNGVGFFFLAQPAGNSGNQSLGSLLRTLRTQGAGSQAVHQQGDRIAASLGIDGSTISGNSASASGMADFVAGGGIANGGAAMTLANSTISGNSISALANPVESESDGGGILNGDGVVEASNVTIAHNVLHGGTSPGSFSGGGAVADFGDMLLTNATINANSVTGFTVGAGLNPGGIRPNDGIRSLGGGLVGGAVLANSILAANTLNGTVNNCDVENSYLDQKGNLEDANPSSCGFSAANGDVVGQDPQLGPLQDNGSILAGAPGSLAPLFTEAIPLTSPAANLGVAATCETLVGPDGVTTDTDERGLPRNSAVRGNCDSGAYDTGDDITLPATIAGAVNALSGAGIRLGFAGPSGAGFPVAYITLQKGPNTLVARGPLTLDCPDQCVGTKAIPVPGTITLTLTGTASSVRGPLFPPGSTVKAVITFTNSRLGAGAGIFRQALVTAHVQVFAPNSVTPVLDTMVSGPFNPQSAVNAVPAS